MGLIICRGGRWHLGERHRRKAYRFRLEEKRQARYRSVVTDGCQHTPGSINR